MKNYKIYVILLAIITAMMLIAVVSVRAEDVKIYTFNVGNDLYLCQFTPIGQDQSGVTNGYVTLWIMGTETFWGSTYHDKGEIVYIDLVTGFFIRLSDLSLIYSPPGTLRMVLE